MARGSLRACHLLVIVGLATTSNAFAKGGDSKDRQVAEARKACLTGDYQKGVAILSELFVKTEAPNHLYNQGRCFEQNARYEEAILRFEEYLRVTKGSDDKERVQAEEHIADCRAKVAMSATVAPPPAPSPTPIAVQQQAPLEPKPVVTASEGRPAAPAAGSGLRIAGIAVAGLGVASLVTAVVLNIKANGIADDLNKPAGYDRDKVSRRSSYETGSWVGYGVGSACLAGGAILYYLGHSPGSSGAVALVPVIAPDQAGVAFHGGF
jgi:hypothetical protein